MVVAAEHGAAGQRVKMTEQVEKLASVAYPGVVCSMRAGHLMRTGDTRLGAWFRCVGLAMILFAGLAAPAYGETWTCRFIANSPESPVQVTSKFRVEGAELHEFETVPRALSFGERYTILENNEEHIVAALSITRLGDRPPPGAVGAVVIIIGKKSGIFQQSGVILAFRPGPPTVGRCSHDGQ